MLEPEVMEQRSYRGARRNDPDADAPLVAVELGEQEAREGVHVMRWSVAVPAT